MYEILMIFLALVSVVITLLDLTERIVPTPTLIAIDYSIWFIFIADYVIRFYKAKNKKDFFRKNIFDFISILPFNAFLRAFRVLRLFRFAKLARLARLVKLTKLFALLTRFTSKANKILNTNSFIYVLYINFTIIFLGAISIYILENGTTVHSFADSIWWAFVTATTVGYGDISPTTGIGRIIAVVLMLSGIGTIGMLTSTLSTFFIHKKESSQKVNNNLVNEIMNLPSEQQKIIYDIIKNFKRD